jgi:hypothetical protein
MRPLLLLALLALGGCGTGTQRAIPLASLQEMKLDCDNAELQLRWLNQQVELTGYKQDSSEYEQKYIATLKEMIWNLRSQCYRSVSSDKFRP